VLVAGDLFDTFNPPSEAVDLLYKTLKRLTGNGRRPVIAIAVTTTPPTALKRPTRWPANAGSFYRLPQFRSHSF
jgi:exonuclease SbcD